MPMVVQLISLAAGGSTPFDGEYLVEYDPDREGLSPDGELMLAHVVTSPDVGQARRFKDAVELHQYIYKIAAHTPTRPDGKPNRPLSAYTMHATIVP